MKTLISARKKEVTFSMQWKQVEQVVTCVSLFNLNVHLEMISPEDTADKPDDTVQQTGNSCQDAGIKEQDLPHFFD